MSSLASILPHLEERFAHQRLVFWHDPDGDYAQDLSNLNLQGITVVVVANNEYALKYRILQEEPDGKFLVYRCGPVPVGIGNWLLDLELAYGVFKADRKALLRQDLGLTTTNVETILGAHESFFLQAYRGTQRSLKP